MHAFGAKKVDLSTLLSQSHVISLHCNLTGETRHILDEKAFHGMKQMPVVINTARGAVMDEKALLRALQTGGVHSAGLDVFEHEPPSESKLIRHPNLIATPHIAAQTKESQSRAAAHAAEEIVRFTKGLPLRWQIG